MIPLLLLIAGCPKPPPVADPALVAPDPSVVRPPVVTGTLTGDLWTDAEHPFSLRVPPGWSATPGGDEALRLVLSQPSTGVVVEVSLAPPGATGPEPRAGCIWDFVDTARYRVLHLPGEITVATCTPTRPDDPRVLGWYFGDADRPWRVEASVPPGVLLPAKGEVEAMLGSVRLR